MDVYARNFHVQHKEQDAAGFKIIAGGMLFLGERDEHVQLLNDALLQGIEGIEKVFV